MGPAKCEPKNCGIFPDVLRGIAVGTATTFGSTMNIMCGYGRVVKGTTDTSKEVTCEESGQWSNFPGCVVQSCDKLETFFDVTDSPAATVVYEWQTEGNQEPNPINLNTK